MKALPCHIHAERQAMLERYLHAWLTSHALALSDLGKAKVREDLLRTLSGDLGAILGRKAEVLAGLVGVEVMQLGADLLIKGAMWLRAPKK
jgi:hypothetical protein